MMQTAVPDPYRGIQLGESQTNAGQLQVNEALADKPETINEDAYGDGWLFVVEVADAEQLNDIMAGKEPRPPKDWTPRNPPSSDGGNSSGGNPASNAEPSPTTA